MNDIIQDTASGIIRNQKDWDKYLYTIENSKDSIWNYIAHEAQQDRMDSEVEKIIKAALISYGSYRFIDESRSLKVFVVDTRLIKPSSIHNSEVDQLRRKKLVKIHGLIL